MPAAFIGDSRGDQGPLLLLPWDGCTSVRLGDGEDIEGTFVDLSQQQFDWLAALIERHGGVYR